MLTDRAAYRRMMVAMSKIARNSNTTEAIFDLGEALYAMGITRYIVPRFKDDPEGQQVIAARKWLADVNLDELLQRPSGSLGRVYATHMRANQLDPNFFRQIEIADDTAFVLMRLRQNHDLWHVMTGFDASVIGEFGLQAFMLAQLGTPLSMILLSIGMFRVCINAQEVVDMWMDTVVQGWQMGRKARRIFGTDWEAHWDTPLEELRAMYQVQAAKMIPLV